MKILIYTTQSNNYGICISGDMYMRHATSPTSYYTECLEYDADDIDQIPARISEALGLHTEIIESSDHQTGAVCASCECDIIDGCIEKVLFAGDDEIAVITTTCVECGDYCTPRHYQSMYDYCADGVLSNHVLRRNAEEYKVICSEYVPKDDPDIHIDYNNVRKIGGNPYVLICWGEPHDSYILLSAVDEICYIRYVLYGDEYISDGIVYETMESAMEVSDLLQLTLDRVDWREITAAMEV